MVRRATLILLALAGGLAVGLFPAQPEPGIVTQVLGSEDMRPTLAFYAPGRADCREIAHADRAVPPGPGDPSTPLEAVGRPPEGSSLKVAWRTNDNSQVGIVELDGSGQAVALHYVDGFQGHYWAEGAERIISCSRSQVRPECKRWPGELWGYAERQAATYRSGTVDQPRENPHYWAKQIADAHGFRDEQGVWHPEPTNCYPS